MTYLFNSCGKCHDRFELQDFPRIRGDEARRIRGDGIKRITYVTPCFHPIHDECLKNMLETCKSYDNKAVECGMCRKVVKPEKNKLDTTLYRVFIIAINYFPPTFKLALDNSMQKGSLCGQQEEDVCYVCLDSFPSIPIYILKTEQSYRLYHQECAPPEATALTYALLGRVAHTCVQYHYDIRSELEIDPPPASETLSNILKAMTSTVQEAFSYLRGIP